MKRKTRYVCEVCNKEYLLSGEANRCEASHILTNNPQFNMVQDWLKKSDKTVAKILGESKPHYTLQHKVDFLEFKIKRLTAQREEVIKAYRYNNDFRPHLNCVYSCNKISRVIHSILRKVKNLKCTIRDREYSPLKKVIEASEPKLQDPRVRELLNDIYDKLIILK